jgi:predicted nucleic-acid-binding protein
MIGLDTNVLLRFLVRDDAKHAARSARAIRDAAQRGEPVCVGPVVLCEMVWVLTSSYGYPRSEIARVLSDLLDADGLDIERRDVVRAALDDYRAHKADFADCLIGRSNQARGCSETLTFDRRLKRLRTFRVLS